MEVKDGQTETYEEVELLVHRVTHDFLKWKGISEAFYEEWHAEACLAFSLAHHSCDPRRSRFTTWLWHSIWNCLSDKLRREAPHHKTIHLNGSARKIRDHRRSIPWRLEEFLQELSEDARIVVSLVLSGTGTWNGKRPEELRTRLHDLLEGLGWTLERVSESFAEIREALR